jgi:CheY-like chemotaxis protein
MVSKTLNCFLIDDDSDDQEIFCMALEEMGEDVNCIYASDGVDALNRLSDDSFTPDYIFIDMNMPRMNGNQCLKEIKKIKRLRDVPIYMYSTSADPDAVSETKLLGAAGFIVKPTSVAELTRTLNFCLK